MPAAPDLSPHIRRWFGAATTAKGKFAMLAYLTEEIRQSLIKSKDCAREAADQTDPKLKQHFLKLEQHWISVARSYSKRISHDIGDLNLTFD